MWTLSQVDMSYLRISEMKILNREWRISYNELYQRYKSTNIITITINASRLRWAGHAKQMDKNELTRRMLYCKPEGGRSRGPEQNEYERMEFVRI
jgi:hypothetical protein